MNNSPGGGGGGEGEIGVYKKTPWISFFPWKTSLLVHTFMCISQVDSSLGFTKELNKIES